jgi:glycosyltransferase involved in cell wall biosynthesis
LADRYDVHIVSLYRSRQRPSFDFDPRVQFHELIVGGPNSDTHRGPIERRLLQRPSRFVPSEMLGSKYYNGLTDVRLLNLLLRLDADVVVGTRWGLNLIIGRFHRRGVGTIGQEHSAWERYDKEQRAVLKQAFSGLDAVCALTASDAKGIRRLLGGRTRVVQIPNSLREEVPPRSDGAQPRIVALGRIAGFKAFNRLVRAFGRLADQHPGWQLRIYGGGPKERKLRRMIHARGLEGRVLLMGWTDRPLHELAKASIHAMSSRSESFGMVLIEAMSCGVPSVALDCPRGPRAILDHGSNGLLLPNDKHVRRLVRGLRKLIEDEDLRQRLAAGSLASADEYTPHRVAQRWEQLIMDVRPD